ncbi:MAG: putative Ig domain-containing protein [Planctomycetes bacterium]|nr:putative Ig domain-containing protein [Planctomycetota bacterium]
MNIHKLSFAAVAALLFAGALSAQVPEVYYYKVNEGTGNTTANSANPGQGTANPTFSVGPTWVAPGHLGAAHITGATELPTGAGLPFTAATPFTIECWINLGATTALNYLFGDSGAGSFRCFAGGVAPSGGLILRGGGFTDITIPGCIDGTFHHIAFVYDGAGTMTSYRDGTQVNQNTAQNPTTIGNGTNFTAFGYNASTGDFTGQRDDFRVWSTARSQAEIAANMNSELPAVVSLGVSMSGPASNVGSATLTDFVAARLNLTAQTATTQDVSSITLTRTGSALDSDFTAVKLFSDTNANGVIDGGEPQVGSNQTFASGTATFAGTPLVSITGNTTARLLVALTTATGFASGTTFGVQIAASTDVTTAPGPISSSSVFPANGPTHVAVFVNTFPYLEDFESGAGGWAVTGTVTTWALGTPAKPVINSAYSGSNAWVTGLSAAYLNGENGAVVSPVVDLSSFATDPWVSVHVWWNSEFSWDGMNLQSSIDGGSSWQTVGAVGDPNNWYTDASIAGLAFSGSQSGWSGRASSANGSNGWVRALHQLTGLGGQASVLLRMTFGSDGSVVDANGVAFDDFSIGTLHEINVLRNSTGIPHLGSVNVGNINITTPGQVTFDIENLGGLVTNLTGTSPNYVVVTAGSNLDSVSVTSQPGTPVVFGTAQSFTIEIDPTAVAQFDFTVTIANDDISPVQLANGTDGVLTAASLEFSSATANFVAAHVGTQIVISGSALANDGTYTIASIVNSTTVTLTAAPAADEGTLAWSHEASEAAYTFTVTGDGVINGPAQADPATGSTFTGPTNGPLTLAVNPGATLANADVELTDAESDNITVASITAPAIVPTGIVPPAVPGAPGHPVVLSWTGTADASNDPGVYTWTVTFSDAVNGASIVVQVSITINDVPPTHTAATGITGDGLSAGTQYVAGVPVGAAGATDIADATDGNTSQTLTIDAQNQVSVPGGSTITFTFSMAASNPTTLQATPSAAPVVADIGDYDYTVDITDQIAGGNVVTIFVRLTVSGTAPTITSAAAPTAAFETVLYTHTFTATGNPAPTFAVTAGTLPTWLTLDANTGVLTGTPGVGDVGGSFDVSAQNGVLPDDTESVTITVAVGTAPTITSAAAPTTATVGTLYTHTFTVTGTPAPTLSATGLPAWLTFNPGTGVLSGTPAAADVGTAGPITITASNGITPNDTEIFSIVVSAASSGGGGGGGGGSDGGCSTDSGNSSWLVLFAALAGLGFALRLRKSRA